MSIRFAAIGMVHDHIYTLTQQLLDAGAKLELYYADDVNNLQKFALHFAAGNAAPSIDSILNNDQIDLIISAPLPSERATLGIRTMQAGKDYLTDKPVFLSLESLNHARQVQQETGQIFSIYYSERFASPATVFAEQLVADGAIGTVIQTVGVGPHIMKPEVRPDWFFQRTQVGGILIDLACHQIDQFLTFTKNATAEIVSAQVGNLQHPQYPELEDFGDIVLREGKTTGYMRVDWFTPRGLGVWGDVRLFIMGTDGTIEIRKNIDLDGKPSDNHLYLVNHDGIQYFDCKDMLTPFGEQIVADVLNRTETAMTQAHCFAVAELALKAQQQAIRLD